MVKGLAVYRVASPFDRRCTALEWHPKDKNILAVGSKGGDIIIWNTEKIDHDIFIKGVIVFYLYVAVKKDTFIKG